MSRRENWYGGLSRDIHVRSTYEISSSWFHDAILELGASPFKKRKGEGLSIGVRQLCATGGVFRGENDSSAVELYTVYLTSLEACHVVRTLFL